MCREKESLLTSGCFDITCSYSDTNWVHVVAMLTLKAPSKFVEDNIYFHFLNFSKINKSWYFMWIVCQADDSHEIFQRKQVLIFHVNCLPSRWFTWNIMTCFPWKIKKKYFKMFAAVVIGALRVYTCVVAMLIHFKTNTGGGRGVSLVFFHYYICPKIWTSPL